VLVQEISSSRIVKYVSSIKCPLTIFPTLGFGRGIHLIIPRLNILAMSRSELVRGKSIMIFLVFFSGSESIQEEVSYSTLVREGETIKGFKEHSKAWKKKAWIRLQKLNPKFPLLKLLCFLVFMYL